MKYGAPNSMLQRTAGSRCSPCAAELMGVMSLDRHFCTFVPPFMKGGKGDFPGCDALKSPLPPLAKGGKNLCPPT